jgi:tetratricopeptide (TPR) repeat protein
LKVEQALKLLPPIEALTPLRFLLLSNARGDDRVVWEGSGAYRTVGKRDIQTRELRRQMGAMLEKVARDRYESYDAYVDALDCMQEGDRAGAVAQLLRAGRTGESAWLLEQARAWYGVAFELAGTARGRQPEIDALLALGRVSMRLGRFQEAGRHLQRGLALAEAELDNAGAADACVGLGNIALEQSLGATSALAWYGRGLIFARAASDERRIAELQLDLGEAYCRAREWALAGDSLREAHETFRNLRDSRGLARVLSLQSVLSAGIGDTRQAAVAYREALAYLVQLEPDSALEVSIRVNYAKVLLESGRYLETDEELRRAEQLAIANDLIHDLVGIYTIMGTAHGRQGDEVGFVFFEQAIELMRMLDHSPLDEAQVCLEYGVFESRVERPEESRAYLERAKRIFESIGASGGLERVEAELHRDSA